MRGKTGGATPANFRGWDDVRIRYTLTIRGGAMIKDTSLTFIVVVAVPTAGAPVGPAQVDLAHLA